VNGVGQVLVVGGRQRQVNIWLDAARLQAYNLTVTDVSKALQSQNAEVPGGRVEAGPEAMTLRNSNCRSIIGIMMGLPHLLQGTVASGGRSPGMNTLVSQQPQVTIFNEAFESLISDAV